MVTIKGVMQLFRHPVLQSTMTGSSNDKNKTSFLALTIVLLAGCSGPEKFDTTSEGDNQARGALSTCAVLDKIAETQCPGSSE